MRCYGMESTSSDVIDGATYFDVFSSVVLIKTICELRRMRTTECEIACNRLYLSYKHMVQRECRTAIYVIL